VDTAETSVTDIMQEIARLAPVKDHRLGPDMVNGRRPLSRQAAEKVLDNLRNCKSKPGAALPAPAAACIPPVPVPPSGLRFADIPEGFYATPSRTGNNDLDFWKVTRSAKTGFTRAKRVIGGGTDKYPKAVDISQGEQVEAMRAILRAGTEQSGALYADNEERCMDCGIHLTNDESRRARRGPVCRNK